MQAFCSFVAVNKETLTISHEVKAKGDWSGVYGNTRSRIILYNWDRDDNIGKKYCYSNAFRKLEVSTRGNDGIIPGYDLYKNLSMLATSSIGNYTTASFLIAAVVNTRVLGMAISTNSPWRSFYRTQSIYIAM